MFGVFHWSPTDWKCALKNVPNIGSGSLSLLGWLILISLFSLLAYCGQKEVRLVFERDEARSACEVGGGGKLQSEGPIETDGYFNPRCEGCGGIGGSARLLLVDGFKFIESAGEPLTRPGTSGRMINREEVFSRFSLVSRPSSLCKQFDAYFDELTEVSSGAVARRESYFKGMGLKESECVGVEIFSDQSLLKSTYEFRTEKSTDPKIPKIEWMHHQIVARATGEVVSEVSVFALCLDGFFQAEPFYSGCKGGGKNYVRCPLEKPGKDSSDYLGNFYSHGITARRD